MHEGTVHELSGVQQDLMFHGLPYPDRPHFSTFSWAACDAAYRDPDIFASSPDAVDLEGGEIGPTNSMLSMGGPQHRRYRSLVQPSFSPTKASWWIENWIGDTVHALIDSFEAEGRAELNVEFCAAIPVLTITGSFAVPVAQALDIRESLARPEQMVEILAPIVAARREHPEDDLISVLVQSEITDEDGRTHRLSDAEIYSFSLLLLGRRLRHDVEADGNHAGGAVAAPTLSKRCGRIAGCSVRPSRSRCGGNPRTRCFRAG